MTHLPDNEPGYKMAEQTVSVAGRQWHLQTLADRQQYHDPEGQYESAGIPPAMWSLFGVIWPAGLLLAEYMARYPVENRHILETGCGLALASMVVHSRGGKITASDIHPLAADFLAVNLYKNSLTDLPFRVLDWRTAEEESFDLVIGSDLLYERGQPELLAGFIDRHCNTTGEFILTDPGRGQVAKFNRLMQSRGFDVEQTFHGGKSRLVHYRRSTWSQ